jgi:hypothetical protein
MGWIKENITKGKGEKIGKWGENIYKHKDCSLLGFNMQKFKIECL